MQFYLGLLALLALGVLACIAVMPWLSLALVHFGVGPLLPSEFVALSAWPWLLGALVAGVVLYAFGRWMTKTFARS
jgi:hypothetical protein